MALDDAILSAQRAIDRAVRRFRRGAAPVETQRRLLIVQIDGLSRTVLEPALEHGRAPFMKKLLKSHGYCLEPMSVGLPTSTPAFQMAAMYGVRPDIPGFHYYDRGRGGDIHFPRAGHAAYVEHKLASGRRGVLEGGSAYGCCFTGGARNNFFTFTSMTRPTGSGVLSAFSPFFVVAWVIAKNAVLSAGELFKAVPRFIARPRMRRRGWRWLHIKILMSIWVRNFFTLAVSRDLYEGVPAIYVNYLAYDEMAHAFGPRSRNALQALREIDGAMAALWRVMRRVPEHQYDAYILADHGQSSCTPYAEITRGMRLERWIFDEFLDRAGAATSEAPRIGLRRGIRARQAGAKGMIQQFMNYLDEDYFRRPDPEAYEHNGIRVISAGPNAFLYVLDAPAPLDAAALESRFPGLGETLSSSPGVGFVFARSGNGGVVCYWRGRRFELREDEAGPFAGRADAALVVRGVADLMAMSSAGDFFIYGNDASDGTVSFLREHGAHAGPGSDEMQTFILSPPGVILPQSITHPTQLYGHFIRYSNPPQST
jgi:hypothetical protein